MEPVAAFTEREVAFEGVGGAKLYGTLVLPTGKAKARVPGMVLVVGSGPTDRNGNQGPLKTDLHRQIAERLAKQGIATLRYDKRAIGASKAPTYELGALGKFVAWENYVSDVEAAFRWLQKQPEIDPARSGLLGHSEGGTLVLQAAERMKDHPKPPAALVLLSTPGRKMETILHDQLARILKAQQANPEQTKFFLDKNAAICAAIRKTGVVPPDVPPGLAALFPGYLGQFLQSMFKADVVTWAAGYSGPVLVLQGERDVQILAKKDAVALDRALKSRAHDDHTLVIVPGLSHNLKPVQNENEPGFEGAMSPEASEKIASWLSAKLGKR